MDQQPAEETGGDGRFRDPPLTVGERICQRRNALGWRQPQLARRFREVGACFQGGAPKQKSMVEMISRWEGDVVVPDQYNRRILAMALGVKVSDLGLTADRFFVLLPAKPGRAATAGGR